MISSLTSLADRNFIIGFLLPALIAAMIFVGVCQDIPMVRETWDKVVDAQTFTTLTLFILLVWVASVGLMAFNTVLYKILEGYYGPLSGKCRVDDAKKKFKAAKDNVTELNNDPKRYDEYLKALRDFRKNYPNREDLVLPTRFGNVVRAFESYPFKVYGIDAIPAWDRIASVVPESFQRVVDSARAVLDFFVNAVFLLLFLATIFLFRVVKSVLEIGIDLAQGHAIAWHDFPLSCLVAAPVALVLAWASYQGALTQAVPWGNTVRSAFDLYLPALAKQLGYELPSTLAGRREFWDAVNSMFLYNVSIDPAKWQIDGAKPAGEGGHDVRIALTPRSVTIVSSPS